MRSARAQKRDAARAAGSVRERVLPPRVTTRIQAKMTESDRLRAEANDLIVATLEGMGLDIAPRDDGLVWNVTDGEKGTLVARFGPRVTAMPDLASIEKIVREAAAGAPKDVPAVETPEKPALG